LTASTYPPMQVRRPRLLALGDGALRRNLVSVRHLQVKGDNKMHWLGFV
jgi:hypothetical protein